MEYIVKNKNDNFLVLRYLTTQRFFLRVFIVFEIFFK